MFVHVVGGGLAKRCSVESGVKVKYLSRVHDPLELAYILTSIQTHVRLKARYRVMSLASSRP